MNFLKLAVALSLIVCLIFTTAVIVLEMRGVEVSDTLIQWFFTVFGVEFATTGAIQIVKYRVRKQETDDYIEALKKNNLEVSKSDFKTKNNDDYYYYNNYDTEGDDSVG